MTTNPMTSTTSQETLCIGGPLDGKRVAAIGRSVICAAHPKDLVYKGEVIQEFRSSGLCRWLVFVHGELPDADAVLHWLREAGLPPHQVFAIPHTEDAPE